MANATTYEMVKPKPGTPLVNPEYSRGAHYYAFSKNLSTDQYTEVMAWIKLPTDIIWTGDSRKRNIYISFGLAQYIDPSWVHSCDMGIGNVEDGGWHLCYGGTVYPKTFHHNVIFPKNTVWVILTAKNDKEHDPDGMSRMILTAQCLDENKNVIRVAGNDIVYWEFDVERHDWNRYYRFISFLHTGTNSISDGTRMLNAQFTSLQIFDKTIGTKGSYVNWGIPVTSNLIQNAWIVGAPQGYFTAGSITNTAETFNVYNNA